MKLGDAQEAFAAMYADLLTYAISKGYAIRLGETQRPIEMQQIYVKTGKSKTLNSYHLDKCAADLHFVKDGEICYPEEIGKYWESLHPQNSAGMFWSKFKDAPHFEFRWRNVK